MPANISTCASKGINGYFLTGKECGAKPDSHGRSVVSVFHAGNESMRFVRSHDEKYFVMPC